MTKKTLEYLSADGKTMIKAAAWLPEGEPAGIIQVAHGMCEYFGRYTPFAEECCKAGYVVCGNDHLGHGLTAAVPEDLGYFAEKDGWKFLASDLYTLTMLMKQDYPGLPYFLLGHSMGSFIARDYIGRYGEGLNGAIIMGTSGRNPLAGAGLFITKLIGAFRGSRYRSAFVKNLSFGHYNDRCPEKRGPNDWLSKDHEIVDKYSDDPFCTYTFTVSAFHDLMSLLSYVTSPKGAEGVPPALPILLISGADDPVGSYGKGVEETAALLRSAGCGAVTVKLFENDRHEVLNETDRAQVIEYILGWLKPLLG